MGIKMQEMIDMVTNMRLKELEFKEMEKQMGNRILLSGTQVGMVIGCLRAVKEITEEIIPKTGIPKQIINKCESIYKSAELIEKEMLDCLKKQSVGHSSNPLEEDVQDIMNLFASWCSKTGE